MTSSIAAPAGRDVVITGVGAVSCLGAGVDAFWRGLSAAASQPRRVPDPDAHMPSPVMYLVPDADVPAPVPDATAHDPGRAGRLTLLAAEEALRNAGFDDTSPLPGDRTAVLLGTGMGESNRHEQWRSTTFPDTDRWVPVFSPATDLAAAIGAQVGATSVSNACAASGFALSSAADMIAAGEADVVVAGGAEAYSRVALACFNRLGAIDPQRCRPFAADRQGTMFGEGAAIVVLESAEHARARGAREVYAQLAGSGWSCDAYHNTAPEPGGEQIAAAMREALTRGGASVDDLGCIVPHGTGTQLNDMVESAALGDVLAAAAPDVPLYSLKALIGHTGGAAAAMAVVAAVLILRHGHVPPNVAVGALDPACSSWLPDDTATPLKGGSALVNAYAFGGNNVSLLLRTVPS